MSVQQIPVVSDSLCHSESLFPALQKTGEILEIIEDRKLCVFLDYDGTLTPIVDRPENACLSQGMRDTIGSLSLLCTVGIISGRDLNDVRDLVSLPNLLYAGSHGFEISSQRHRHLRHERGAEFLPVLEQTAAALNRELADIPGAMVERKKYAIAVHFRHVEENMAGEVERRVEAVVTESGKLAWSAGKKVFDIKPDINWNKGKALLWLIEKLQMDRPDIIPIYIGDDTTDEDAFRVMDRIGGIGLIVRDVDSRPTSAQYALDNTDEVRLFLDFLVDTSARTRQYWSLTYNDYEPAKEGLREALCTLGNGYFAVRGAAAESRADGVHYPGTYLAGGYNRLSTEIADRMVENEDLVNIPNWLPLCFGLDEGEWFDADSVDILSYCQELDIKSGILYRRIRFRDAEGRESRYFSRRFVHMENAHLAAEEISITAENWSGPLNIRTALDGTVVNSGVARYKNLNNRHLHPVRADVIDPGVLYLKVGTTQSDLKIAMAAKTRVFKNTEELTLDWQTVKSDAYIELNTGTILEKGDTVTVEKIVSLYTSRDRAISEAGLEARNGIKQTGSFHELSKTHMMSWWQLWRSFAVRFQSEVESSRHSGMILNLYIFHLLQTVSLHTIDLDAGVPARGWHGEAYRGHIFWDELFIFPFLNFRLPEITRALLKYRYRRLDAARSAAKSAGYKGAMFPWQSGSSGREETQIVHYNPRSGRWLPDNSHLQRHVNIAIAYNLWQYYQVTNDTEFVSFYGAEILLEIARFLAGLASYDKDSGRYEIKHVMGPDEYHDAYPEGEERGLNNNSYTNIMTVWVLCRALRILEVLHSKRRIELCKKIGLDGDELSKWEAISRNMKVVFHEDGVISQFEGFEDLKEFDWKGYIEKYGDIHRLDRILEAEGDTPNRYKLSKQADTLMLFFLLSREELDRIFNRLSYSFNPDMIPKTISYYLKRTSHGSTLSRVVHSWVLARSTRPGSWRLFCEALKSDLEDVQGGTTAEGIHLGAMAGTVDLMTRGYTGLEVRDKILWFNPCLPPEFGDIHMHLRYQSQTLEIDVKIDRLTVYLPPGEQPPVTIGCGEEVVEMHPGQTRDFAITCSIPVLSPDEMEEFVV